MKSHRVIIVSLLSVWFTLTANAQKETLSNKPVNEDGLYLGLTFGTWFPDNVNKVLGSPLIFGPVLMGKIGNNTWGFSFDLIGWPQHTTREPINVKMRDTVLSRDEFYGMHVTLDYARQLAAKGRFIFEGIGSAGYGRLSYYNPDKDTNIGNASILFSPGVSVRYLVRQGSFWQFKIQYCLANYKMHDNVSTNFKGNYLIVKFILGQTPNHGD